MGYQHLKTLKVPVFAPFCGVFAAHFPNRGEGGLNMRDFSRIVTQQPKTLFFASFCSQNYTQNPNGGEVGVFCVEFYGAVILWVFFRIFR